MRTIILSGFGLVSLCFCAEVIGAPTEDPPLPSGPLLRKMANYSAIQITYTYSSDQTDSSSAPGAAPTAPPAPTLFPTSLIRQLTLTRTKPLWHSVGLVIDGNTVEEWYNGSDYFYTAPGIPEPLLNDPPAPAEPRGPVPIDPTALPNFNRFDFPDMEWISGKTYTGIEIVEGHKCLVFNKDNQTAWIDLETRFPIQWERGGEKRTFQQLPPPTEPLTLPPKVAHIAAGMKHDRDKWANWALPPNKN